MNNDAEVKALESKDNLPFKRKLELSSLSDPKVIFLWVATFAVFTFVLLPLFSHVLAAAAPTFGFTALYFFSCVLIGAIFGMLCVLGVRSVSRLVLGNDRKAAQQAEARLAAGKSTDLVDDLNTLVTENLKLKRYQVAEFYSKQLLELAEKPIKPEAVKATSCWVNSSEYQGSFRYKYVWLFENKGTISLTSTHFQIESPKISFNVPLSNLLEVKVDRHPLWIKPYPMRYLVITFKEKGFEHTYYVSPNYLQTDTVIDINNYVKEWHGYLTEAITKHKHVSVLQKLSDCVSESDSINESEDIGELIDQMNNI